MRRKIAVSFLAALTLMVAGCKQKAEPTAASAPPSAIIADPGGKTGGSCTDCGSKKDKAAKPASKDSQASAGNTVCPVMKGRAVNPNLYVEYQGQKVYLCCQKCVDLFKAEPAKYATNLKASGSA